MNSKKFYEIWGKLDRLEITPNDELIHTLLRIRRLERKNQRLAEADCNGEGVVNGKFYRLDGSVKGAYLADGETSIFTAEGEKIEKKITKMLEPFNYVAEFQGDPRGYTVRIFTPDHRDVSHIIFE
jgi:hypothetical protein